MEASSGVQLDGSTTIEVGGGARGAGRVSEVMVNYAGSDGELFIVSNTNVIVMCRK